MLFRTWHAAGLGLSLLDAGRPEEAEPWIREALAGAPPLALFEARLAAARLAFAVGDPAAPAEARALRRDAEAVGYLAIVHGVVPPAG